MIIGLDFDNTIVDYDGIFYKIALEKNLIPGEIDRSKKGVQNYLSANGKGEEWTKLQGLVYGPKIINAQLYPDSLEFLEWCNQNGIKICIISHKTKYPYLGEKYDLHASAKLFLELNLFFTEKTGLTSQNVIFNETIREKLAFIGRLGCDFFIDDLLENLKSDLFPKRTKPVWFNPNYNPGSGEMAIEVNSWNDFKELIKIAKILGTNQVEKISGGRNNRSFKVCPNGAAYFVKSYFTHPEDRRDRLNAEFSFSEFVYGNKIEAVPKPIRKYKDENIGVYSFVKGNKISASELNPDYIYQALDFFLKINEYKNTSKALLLPLASEVCFSIKEHLDCVKQRIDKLTAIEPNSEINVSVLNFITTSLMSSFKKVSKVILNNAININQQLKPMERCISPSDFGFHNALVAEDKVIFTDFEYAGWDDPAKFVCDFFCQPEVRIPLSFFNQFSQNILGKESARAKLLLPLYQLKWCCIMLNEFLPIGNERRLFSNRSALELQKIQFEKVQKYFRDTQHINSFIGR